MFTKEVKDALWFFGHVEADKRIQAACERYLANQPFTLWGDWDISDEQRRRMAAAWLTFQWERVADEMRVRDWVRAFGDSRRRKVMAWLARKGWFGGGS